VARWIVLFCLLAAASITGGCISHIKPEVITPAKDQAGADDRSFVLSDLSGKEVRFPQEFSGQKVLVVFFSTG